MCAFSGPPFQDAQVVVYGYGKSQPIEISPPLLAVTPLRCWLVTAPLARLKDVDNAVALLALAIAQETDLINARYVSTCIHQLPHAELKYGTLCLLSSAAGCHLGGASVPWKPRGFQKPAKTMIKQNGYKISALSILDYGAHPAVSSRDCWWRTSWASFKLTNRNN